MALLLFVGLFPVAADAASMTYSDALVNYIKYGEGFSPTLYQDTGGWCIGYGCIVNPDDYPGYDLAKKVYARTNDATTDKTFQKMYQMLMAGDPKKRTYRVLVGDLYRDTQNRDGIIKKRK